MSERRLLDVEYSNFLNNPREDRRYIDEFNRTSVHFEAEKEAPFVDPVTCRKKTRIRLVLETEIALDDNEHVGYDQHLIAETRMLRTIFGPFEAGLVSVLHRIQDSEKQKALEEIDDLLSAIKCNGRL